MHIEKKTLFFTQLRANFTLIGVVIYNFLAAITRV